MLACSSSSSSSGTSSSSSSTSTSHQQPTAPWQIAPQQQVALSARPLRLLLVAVLPICGGPQPHTQHNRPAWPPSSSSSRYSKGTSSRVSQAHLSAPKQHPMRLLRPPPCLYRQAGALERRQQPQQAQLQLQLLLLPESLQAHRPHQPRQQQQRPQQRQQHPSLPSTRNVVGLAV
jgi:hypothetical protein